MVAIPILLPLVKPFRASWSGKPFFVQFLTADNRENKASVRSEDFTEYPIWHKLRKAAGCFPCSQAKRHLLPYRPFVSLYRKIHREWKCLTKERIRQLLKMNV